MFIALKRLRRSVAANNRQHGSLLDTVALIAPPPARQHKDLAVDLRTVPVAWLDVILAFTLLEWLALALRRRLSGRGLGLGDLSLGLVPGLLLMLALRLAAPAEVPPGVLLCCAAAGLFHAWDFVRRIRAADRVPPPPAAAP